MNPSTSRKLKQLAVAAGAAAAASANAQSVFTQFTFETSLTSTQTTAASVGGFLAEVGSGTASGVHLAATTVYSAPAGNGSTRAFSANTWASGDYYQFAVPTTGFQDLLVKFEMTRSGTGPDKFDFEYSTNGTTFVPFSGSIEVDLGTAATFAAFSSAAAVPTSVAGVYFSFDLTTIDTLENNSSVVFRIISNGLNSTGGSVAAAGTARIDNFSVAGTAVVPEPSSVALALGAASLAFVGARRRK